MTSRTNGPSSLQFLRVFTRSGASAGWGRPASVIIRAGFGPVAEDVPRALQVAILQVVGHWYDNRAAGDFPGSAEALISAFRMRRI